MQPGALTREAFWEHLVQCYTEAYPNTDSVTGSPLAFGFVCKELHKDAPRAEGRSEHNHAATIVNHADVLAPDARHLAP